MDFCLYTQIFIIFLLSCFLCKTSVAKVPAVYVLGDSLADAGNNHYLKLTVLRADFPHNGVDYIGGKATGRFSNGKTAADFIVEKLGLTSPPAFLSISSKNTNITHIYLNGINFASGGAGVLKATNFGLCKSFDKQIEQFAEVKEQLEQQLGMEKTQNHISKSVFAIIIGSNDILGYTRFAGRKSPQELVNKMTTALQRQLKLMYNLGARKFAVVGTTLIGCCPSLREKSKTQDCDAEANNMSNQFAQDSALALNHMKSELADMNYSFFNCSAALIEYIEKPQNYGFTETKSACCGRGKLEAKVACIPVSKLCSNRSDHVFWDLFHPTEATSKLLVNTYYGGSSPYVYPINLKALGEL